MTCDQSYGISATLYFVRNHGEYRRITIWRDGTYKIEGIIRGYGGKQHSDTTAYISKLLHNGWRKTNFRTWFAYYAGK